MDRGLTDDARSGHETISQQWPCPVSHLLRTSESQESGAKDSGVPNLTSSRNERPSTTSGLLRRRVVWYNSG